MTLDLSRRRLLTGALGFLAAPVLIRATSLMQVRTIKAVPLPDEFWVINGIRFKIYFPNRLYAVGSSDIHTIRSDGTETFERIEYGPCA